MIADGFDHRGNAAVANTETLSRHATDVSFAAGGAIKGNIANNDVFFRNERGKLRRKDNDFAARQAFADVIVRIAFEVKSHSLGHEGTETLAGAAGEVNLDSVFRQSLGTPAPGDFRTDNSPDDAIHISDWQNGNDFFLSLDCGSAKPQQEGIVQSLVQTMVLRNLAESSDFGGHFWLVQDVAEIQALGLPMFDRFPYFET